MKGVVIKVYNHVDSMLVSKGFIDAPYLPPKIDKGQTNRYVVPRRFYVVPRIIHKARQ